MELYGTDKPDLRFEMEMKDVSAYARRSSFQAFKDALAEGEARRAKDAAKGINSQGGAVKALVVPGKADYSRKQIEELEARGQDLPRQGPRMDESRRAERPSSKAASRSSSRGEGACAGASTARAPSPSSARSRAT